MFWFPAPEVKDPKVMEFLAFEMDYLKGEWTAEKIAVSLLVPLFFFMLLMFAWKRSLKWLFGVIIGAAFLKSSWSIIFGGKAGMSVLKPALTGLIICAVFLGYFFKKQKQNK